MIFFFFDSWKSGQFEISGQKWIFYSSSNNIISHSKIIYIFSYERCLKISLFFVSIWIYSWNCIVYIHIEWNECQSAVTYVDAEPDIHSHIATLLFRHSAFARRTPRRTHSIRHGSILECTRTHTQTKTACYTINSGPEVNSIFGKSFFLDAHSYKCVIPQQENSKYHLTGMHTCK